MCGQRDVTLPIPSQNCNDHECARRTSNNANPCHTRGRTRGGRNLFHVPERELAREVRKERSLGKIAELKIVVLFNLLRIVAVASVSVHFHGLISFSKGT